MATRNKNKKPVARQVVYLPIPDEFFNCMDEYWAITEKDGVHDECSLLDVLMYTIRRLPVKDAGEAERSLELLQVLKAADKQEADYVEFHHSDFDWIKSQFREHAHKLWAAPDSAYLRKWLEDNAQTKEPEASSNGTHGDITQIAVING